jgi:hypothetical protein
VRGYVGRCIGENFMENGAEMREMERFEVLEFTSRKDLMGKEGE